MPAHSTTFPLAVPESRTVREATDQWTGLETLVRDHSRLLFKVAYGVLRNPHDAEEVVQEVFLRVHRAGIRDVLDLPAWLARIAFRLAVDRRRRPQSEELGDFDRASEEPDAEAVSIHRQRMQRVQKLIAALPEDLRHPLVLSALQELNSRQIAEVLNISEAAVRGRIFRARQLLKEKLQSVTAGKS
jgi:RNA polymerase sigma-70 factor (ECF subfamily)